LEAFPAEVAQRRWAIVKDAGGIGGTQAFAAHTVRFRGITIVAEKLDLQLM
jgi:hypothetical protein